MRVLFALPGLHRYDRGAEVAFLALATEVAKAGANVTVMGSGQPRPSTPYRFVHIAAVGRERFESFPGMPALRSETAYEEATFAAGLLSHYRPRDYDLTVTCGYPFTNWALRRPAVGGRRPAHVFVTQNGDWPAQSDKSEYRYFGCDGLVCTNPDYYERNRGKWPSALIPNGIDLQRFGAGQPERERFGLPDDGFVVLMVSAMIESKRVADGVRAVSRIPDAHLVVAGDGPLRDTIAGIAGTAMPRRFTQVSVPADAMPALYRSADVFLHLSKEESFGNVFLESMASGLPVVAHESERVRWIVGAGEPLVDTADLNAVAAAIEGCRAVSTRRDGPWDRVADFAWDKVARRYLTFFEDVIGRSAMTVNSARSPAANQSDGT